ncbi:hypothetical protein IQ235_16890 [Oscillatoriales cyanobacterium LEGE 11467]|uniref:Uncharacterized protein n=1 Tax=Zarconia navalis LEGE 11467 TaxID=1828826 RepID=A0A928W3C3_9CYAN|nr:hypothetical protein [Zarconia navalis]MBE9042450.1 hypothetical protein [Zarconia navalis LEGE 11467]
MFLTKQTPPPAQEPDGIEIKVRLSEATLIKLIPIVVVLLGSGAWVHSQSAPLPTDLPSDAVEVTP